MPTQPPYWKVLTRRKTLKNEANEETKLNRVLGVFDLTALGVGSTLGAGVYVLAGQIAKDQAGPSVMISFAIAALASALAGICYAEFGARVPKAGSAYVYSYVCIGEFVAFVIGWNLILEYIIGTAGVCRGISLYLDTLINDTLKTSFAEVAPIEWSFLGGYFDFFAFSLAVIFGVLTAFGVETSTMFNNVCTLINIAVLLFVVIAGSIKADIKNWQVESPGNSNGTEYNIGKGGYFPFGVEGTLKGAATCFFGFVGFDCIATTGEEVQTPRRNIPRSILYSLLIIFLCYFGVSTVLTLMVPYYAQDPNAPLPYAFKEVGWITAMWIVTIGGLIGLFASLFGALFPIPRIIYSMAEDGLLFSFLGKLNPRFKTPVTGSIFAAIFTGVIAGIFDLAQLVNLLSIGTLLAYIVVAFSIVILRFMDNGDPTNERIDSPPDENSTLTFNGTKTTFKSIIRQVFNVQRLTTPNSLSTKIVGIVTLLFCFISVACGLLIMNASEAIVNHEPWALVLLGFFVILTLISLAAICLQPQEKCTTIFRVPLVPLVPAISIFINIYLMLQLDVMTWIRFGLWMVIGIPIFLICYCTLDKSNQQIRDRKLSFFKALQESEINDRPEVIENGVCNGLVNSITSRSTEVVDLQSGKIESFDEITSDFSSHVEKADINADIKWFGYASLKEELASSMDKEKLDDNKTDIEEENSVIALLDDVLKYEEDFLDTPIEESVPNFQKLTTVAVIHNSLEQISEEADKQNNAQTKNDLLYSEARELATTLVDDILKSDEIFEAIEARKKCRNETHESMELWNKDSERKRNMSESSQVTLTSVDEDPLHSNSFKNKLSLLIVQTPLEKKEKKIKDSLSPTPEPGQEIKLTKSEADIRRMVLRAIEGISTTQNKDISSKQTADIPAPPRFDPELYKSLATISNRNVRTRPGIDKLIAEPPKEIPAPEEDVPFKKKLEAVLKRGPSNRVQRQGEIAAQVPMIPNGSLTVKRPSQSLHVPNSGNEYKSPRLMRKVKAASTNLEIVDVRNNLRHVNIDRK